MDICIICFAATVPEAMPEHLRFHKRHNHHGPICSTHGPSMYRDSNDNPMPNPCSCAMMNVYA